MERLRLLDSLHYAFVRLPVIVNPKPSWSLEDVRASVEWLCPHQCVALLRVHGGHGVLGDPYSWCITIVREDERAVMKGTPMAPTIEELNAIEVVLRGVGFKRRRWIDVDGEFHDKEL